MRMLLVLIHSGGVLYQVILHTLLYLLYAFIYSCAFFSFCGFYNKKKYCENGDNGENRES